MSIQRHLRLIKGRGSTCKKIFTTFSDFMNYSAASFGVSKMARNEASFVEYDPE
jgi:hypothetical protein